MEILPRPAVWSGVHSASTCTHRAFTCVFDCFAAASPATPFRPLRRFAFAAVSTPPMPPSKARTRPRAAVTRQHTTAARGRNPARRPVGTRIPVVGRVARRRAAPGPVGTCAAPARHPSPYPNTFANQPVMLVGCVIAVPTTTAHAPASMAAWASAGVCTRPSHTTGKPGNSSTA